MRTITTINNAWRFAKEASVIPRTLPEDWLPVDLPHTWNGKDGQDGGNDYYRGTCCYARLLRKEELGEGSVHYLQFDGVNSSAEVYWNGEKLITHHGGYSAFRVKLTNIREENLLVVTADNSPNDFVYPQMADFTFYGGIYRDVTVIATQENHFDLDHYGAPGVKVTPKVEGTDATVRVEAFVTAVREYEVVYEVFAEKQRILKIKSDAAGGDVSSVQSEFTIKNVHLWNGTDDPYLYTLNATLICDGETVDEVSVRFGCRDFRIDPEQGFILNGKPYPLRGVSRHQDGPEIGNALTTEHHRKDMDLICEMGANTIRLAHYQHAQEFYDLCDERGMVVWAEIPYISQHMAAGVENTLLQMTELICQNYNHPSIVVWGLSNEITMGGAKDESMTKNHRQLHDLAHRLDETRLTTAAALTLCPVDAEYLTIPDVVSYNHYFGWYGGNVDMYGPWFDKFHKRYPKRAVGISEYGCEALNWHTSDPKQGDYTEEYQAYYHEEMIKQIMDRPYLWATHVWNMFDFAADARSEGGEAGMNHKGLVTFDRRYKKDAFYAYKAWLGTEPFVHICGKRYVDRVEPVTKVTVYSNQPEVELFADGVSVGRQQKGKYPFFYFEVENAGELHLKAWAGECTDESVIRRVEEMNPDYVMREEGEVINWFEITTPAGYYSINDTIGDVLSTFRGKICALKMVIRLKRLSGGGKSGDGGVSMAGISFSLSGLKGSRMLLNMAKGFSIKRVLIMMGDTITKEQMLEINSMLNRIKK